MKRSRYTEEQIIGILQEQEAGAAVAELCRKHGMSDATFYTWKSKSGGLEVRYPVWRWFAADGPPSRLMSMTRTRRRSPAVRDRKFADSSLEETVSSELVSVLQIPC